MAADISTNKPHGVQQPPEAQLIPDEKVDQILDKAKSQLGENGVRKLVETLEKVSGRAPSTHIPAYPTSGR